MTGVDAAMRDAVFDRGTGHFELDDLVAAAKVYAAVAMDLCT